MKILSVNAGSSSLKFQMYEMPEETVLISGVFERIGLDNSFYTIKINGEKIKKDATLSSHEDAVNILIKELLENKVIESLDEIKGVGHRIVHGADKYSKSLVLNEEILDDISKLNELAPLHNPANISGVRAFMKEIPSAIQVGCFDTAFHQTIKEERFRYAVPDEWYTKYGVRKYGFHGTSHRYINKTISEYLKRDDLKVISCHIGNGGSITAIDSGKVVDTSMGFTPLAGIMMGTRCGDIDASMLSYLAGKTGKTLEELTNDLNKKSGLLGVSEVSSDSRDVENAANDGDAKAILAQEMYARKIANYIAMYNNLLGGADVITLTAGVGENSKTMRKSILDKIASLGVKIDEERNDFRGEFRLISTDDSKIPVYVVPTDEELMIAMDTVELKNKNK